VGVAATQSAGVDGPRPAPAREIGVAVLGAFAAAFGGVGFVVLVGGATILARLRGVGLSGTEGVAVVPKQQLLAAGGDQLLAPVVISLGVTLIWYWLLRTTRWSASRWERPVVALACTAVVVGVWWWLKGFGDRTSTELAFVVVAVSAAAAGVAANHSADDEQARGGQAETMAGDETARDEPVDQATPVADQAVPAPGKPPDGDPPAPKESRVALVRAMRSWLSASRGRTRGSFFVSGLALFGGLVLFFTLVSYGRSLRFPIVHAAAVVSRTGSGFWGIYVGETSDRVYLGQVADRSPADGRRGDHDTGRMIAMPKRDIAALELGANLPLHAAEAQARCLLSEVRAVHAALIAKPVPGEDHPDTFRPDFCS
jgi:hypothetical protein